MTWFYVTAAVFVLVALLWVLPALLRRTPGAVAPGAAASNLAVLRDQLAELDRDLGNGLVTAEQHREARGELERRVIEDARAGADAVPRTAARRTALALGLLIPLGAGLLYLFLGNPAAMQWEATQGAGHKISPQEMDEMVARLAARLQEKPDDGNGWALLGRSYMVMQRFDDAAKAYGRAAETIKDDASLLADYADALAMAQGRSLAGKPLQIVEQALKLDPVNWKALAMAGSAAFDRKDFRKAVDYWQKLRAVLPPDSEFARSVDSNIAEARELGGLKGGVPPQGAAAGAGAAPPAVAPARGAGAVRGTVSLAPALAARAAPDDTVFIYARAAQGPRMPLAIVRKQVRDLPAEFALDDSQAMTPEMKLSNFAEIVVSARVSRASSATPQSGDLTGESAPLKAGGAPVKVVIDKVVP